VTLVADRGDNTQPCECDRFPNTPRCSPQLAKERGCGDDTQQAREAEIYADLLGEAEAIYGRPADASLRAVLRRIAEKEAAR
jgi:hypothetical protein